MIVVRRILAFIAAVVVAEATIALINAHSVMAGLAELGIEMPLATRLSTYAQDVVGLAGTFVPVLALGFAIAFAVAWAVVRWLLPGWRTLSYPLAGAVCLGVVVFLLGQIFLTHLIPVTRSLPGTVAVLACGALGGWVFVALLPATARDEPLERSPA